MSSSSTVTQSSHRICRKCGANIFGAAKSCGACLFESALGPLADGDTDAAIGTESKPVLMEFGDYELLEEIGRGGQGVVYRARQKSLNRLVALKVIGLGQWASTPHLRRFRHEAEAAAKLEHQRIVPIYEIGERDGSCYFSMKFIEGGQLDDFVRDKQLPVRDAAQLLVKIARTVQFAHDHGILHRDIKPGNILVDREGEPHLTDFGLARLVEHDSTITNSFDILGTPSYMAPEQAAGHAKELTAAADVYSLGAVLYHLLTGHPPFAGGTTYETIRMVMETEPQHPRLWNPKIDVDLATICLKCLEKDPARRYSSAGALADDVERSLRHEPIQARRTGILSRGRKWIQRNPTGVTLISSATVLIVAVILIIAKSDVRQMAAPNSVAVLPFENLSDDKESTYFVQGVEEEILMRLATVGALKVISRTSTQDYAARPRDLPQIARQLGVENVVEGSVQKVVDHARINVRLIRAKTNEPLWAESYDRKLNDVFTVEGDVATSVAEALNAKLTGTEQQAIARQPTNNAHAHDAYLRGLAYALRPHAAYYDSDLLSAIQHFTEATNLDPNFSLAWSWLARVASLAYFNRAGNDVTKLPEIARLAVNKVAQLESNSLETALTEAYFQYYCDQNYDAAVASFKKALLISPRSTDALDGLALVSRRTNDWQGSFEYYRQAVELDPRNISLLADEADTFVEARQYSSALAAFDRILEINPANPDALGSKAAIYQTEANLPAAAAILDQVAVDPKSQLIFPFRIQQKIYERKFSEGIALVNEALATVEQSNSWLRSLYLSMLADLQQFSGDIAGARSTWQQLKSEIESLPPEKLEGGVDVRCWAASATAMLGDKGLALTKARAINTRHPDNDRLDLQRLASDRARVAAHAGDDNYAIEQLMIAAENPCSPGGIDYGDMKLNPLWDSLRRDPRFEKIAEAIKPRETGTQSL